jgi:gas vesicle protein
MTMAKSSTNLLLAGLAGLAAGVAIGLLFAPEKGSETRKKIKKGFNDLVDQLQNEFTGDIDDLNASFDSGSDAEEPVRQRAKAKKSK